MAAAAWAGIYPLTAGGYPRGRALAERRAALCGGWGVVRCQR